MTDTVFNRLCRVVDDANRVIGWFLSGYEDVTYPAYTGPGDPLDPVNPRAEVLTQILHDLGVDLTDAAPSLVALAETPVEAPRLLCHVLSQILAAYETAPWFDEEWGRS